MSLPQGHILTAVYERLDAELADGDPPVDVRFAGSGGAAPATYVAIDMPGGETRDTLTTRGYDTTLVLRCHTEHALGQARPLEAMQLAAAAEAALDGWLDPSGSDLGPDHAALYLSNPRWTKNQYDMDGGRQALDVILTYTLKTQSR